MDSLCEFCLLRFVKIMSERTDENEGMDWGEFSGKRGEALLGPYHKVIKVIEGSPRNILSLLNHRAFDTKPVKRQTESEEAIRMRRKNHA